MPHTPFFRSLVMALALGAAPLAWAQSDALVTKRPSPLRDAPADTAGTLATLPAQTALTRLPARQGPYLQVKLANGSTGWVHLFDVNSPTEQSSLAATATGALRGLSSLFGRGPASTNNTPTATVGIRGLGAEDIANAQPNTAALAQMEAQRQDAAQARSFASSAALQAHTVEPLPVPAPPAPPAAPAGRRMESNN